MTNTIEHYLKHLVARCELDPADTTILTSISKQVSKSVALTDRQYELVKQRLRKYQQQFENHGLCELDTAVDTLQMPIRHIDRSKTISIKDQCVEIKFPFNKKTIAQLETIAGKYRQFYSHNKGSNTHLFKIYEPVVNDIVEMFANKQFDIDTAIVKMHDQIRKIKSQELEYVPYVTDHGLINVTDSAKQLALSELGDFNEQNSIKYWDRSVRYGYRKAAKVFRKHSVLAENIANRSEQKMYLNPDAHTLQETAHAIQELDRFPLLITLNRSKELEELITFYKMFDFVPADQQIVLDRVEDNRNPNFVLNQYIKHQGFNTWLDNNIKIVYIFKNNLPKLLVKADWRPIAHLCIGGERQTAITSCYIDEYCDLNIAYDAQSSYWDNRFSRQLNQWP
jgi:ribosome-associated translation inhibitor RaiA